MAADVITIRPRYGRLRELWNERRRHLLLADLLDVEEGDLVENDRKTAFHYAETDRLERRMSSLPVAGPDDLRIMTALLAVKTAHEEGAFPGIDASKILRSIAAYADAIERGRAVA